MLIKTIKALLILSVLFMTATKISANEEKKESITELNRADERHLQSQREFIDNLLKRHIGTKIRVNQQDLNSLQRIINRGLIDKSDRKKLQAMGVILGDLYVKEYPMEWKVFEDKLGRSRAVCIKDNSKYCLFPITMLSRRIEAGLVPQVDKVYKKGLSLVEEHFPKTNFY